MRSDGSTAAYYDIPAEVTTLQQLVEYRGMNENIASIFAYCYPYDEFPAGTLRLQDLIADADMNAQLGEIARAAYRYGLVDHSDKLRDAKKIQFYIAEEIKRLQLKLSKLYPLQHYIRSEIVGLKNASSKAE